MSDSMDLILYESLRKRIINNEDLSEKEWDLFFYIEEKTKGVRIKNNEWSKIFLNSSYAPGTQLKPKQKQELEELKEEYILKNAEEIIESSADVTVPQQNEIRNKPSGITFFNNRQLLFAASTGIVILITSIFLLSNNSKFYTGDLTKKEIARTNSSVEKSSNLSSIEKLPETKTNPDEQQIAEVNSKELEENSNLNNTENYTVNNYLEESFSTDYRGSDTFVKLNKPLPSAVFKRNHNIVFDGVVVSKSGGLTSAILKIYNNLEKNYIDDNPLLKKEIIIKINENADQVFLTSILFNKKPGLYYYVFEDTEGNLLHAGKFLIKE